MNKLNFYKRRLKIKERRLRILKHTGRKKQMAEDEIVD